MKISHLISAASGDSVKPLRCFGYSRVFIWWRSNERHHRLLKAKSESGKHNDLITLFS